MIVGTELEKDLRNIMVRCVSVSKTFISNEIKVEAVKSISLEIYENDFTVIMGSSGSGKSTLLYMLSGLDSVTAGEVYIDGINISKAKEKDIVSIRRKKIGFVFQAINLVPNLSIFENVSVPGYLSKRNKKSVNARAKDLLVSLGLEKELSRLPSNTSGGQQQRAAIARGLINNPKVLFADEPTGALNSKSGENILDIMTGINNEGQTIVMVTHDIKAAARANKVLFLKDGVIDGTIELDKFSKDHSVERERMIYDFVKSRGW